MILNLRFIKFVMIFPNLAQPLSIVLMKIRTLEYLLLRIKKERVIFLISKISQNDQKHREGVNAQASIHI